MKLFKLSIAGFGLIALAACDEVTTDDTFGETGINVADCPEDIPAPYFDTIDRNNTSAAGISVAATTCGWTGLARLNIFQTGVDDLTNGWDEEHLVPSVDFTEGDATTPPSDSLALSLAHVETIDAQIPDQTTLFNSLDEGGLTYVLRAYNDASALTDCAVWGQKPDDVLAGAVPSNNNIGPTAMSEINATNCLIW